MTVEDDRVMPEIAVDVVAEAVRRLCVQAYHQLRDDHLAAPRRGRAAEEPPTLSTGSHAREAIG